MRLYDVHVENPGDEEGVVMSAPRHRREAMADPRCAHPLALVFDNGIARCTNCGFEKEDATPSPSEVKDE